MNIKTIEDILARYYEGETTLAEEKQLKEFFTGNEVPDHLIPDRQMFIHFAEEASQAAPVKRIPEIKAAGNRKMYFITSIAAGLLILVALIPLIRYEMHRNLDLPGAQMPAGLAYEQTKQAILMVSAGLNTGLDAADRFRVLDDALDRINQFNKIYSYQNQFINPDRLKDPSTNK